MKFILIYVIYGGSMFSAKVEERRLEFKTLKACEAAKAELAKQYIRNASCIEMDSK